MILNIVVKAAVMQNEFLYLLISDAKCIALYQPHFDKS